MIRIELNEVPVPWAAPRLSKKGRYSPRCKDKAWAQWQIRNAYRDKPIEGYVVLDFTFIEPPPLSASKKTKALMLSGTLFPTRCDCSNMTKHYEDCIKNIVFLDDRYVVKNISSKLYGEKGKVIIKVYTLEEYRKLNADHIG